MFSVLATALLGVPSPAAPAGAGVGKARVGMTVAEVSAAYPGMKKLTGSLGAAVVTSPFIRRYVIEKQKVAGLPKPADVELRFWKGKLWVLIVYYHANPVDDVKTLLSGSYGKARGGEVSLSWEGEDAAIVLVPKAKWYSIADKALSTEVQALFREDLKRRLAGGGRAKAPAAARAAAKHKAGASRDAEQRHAK